MKSYEHLKIEKKWQKKWEEGGLYKTDDRSKGEKQYLLIEFPYPSGEGLHVGHARSYTALDIVARKRRAEGKNILYPIGWDAFGLPTENYAIKTGEHPKEVTKTNTDIFRRQLKSLGFSFDWSREINTTDPLYYKWTQWIFLQMFKKGLAYKAKIPINWCISCKIGLANEEVVDGVCERCGGETEKREKEQWMLAITKYADRLYDDLDTVDYWDRIKIQQRNWIGRSTGANITFKIKNKKEEIEVFTTRPDTLFGATYMILAPEHELVQKLKPQIKNWDKVEEYVVRTEKRTEIERTAEGKEKTGVELKGVVAINPANKEEIPVFIADYVLAHYGTGAIMAVPAHDERDFDFAKMFNISMRHVIAPQVIDSSNPPQEGKEDTFRKIILAIVRNPKNGKYLCLRWKDQPWTTFITGGCEEGEDVVESARREVAEETGYKNLKLIRPLGGVIESQFYAAHKGVNRRVHNQAVLFELVDEQKEEISKEEQAIHTHEWLTPEQVVTAKLQHAEFDLVWNRIKTGVDVYTGEGILHSSGKFNERYSEEAKSEITSFVKGEKNTTYKLRDWVFSRQRYWGEPIPMIHCEKCDWVPVPEEDLPVKLPEVDKYEPTDSGDSPLALIKEWVTVKCPKCKGAAKRETDTMPNWAGSSWYYLRYTDPHNDKNLAGAKQLKEWTPVDWYNGGMEHTTLHLLYSRFWHKFLYDIKVVPTEEPYNKRTSHGLILADGGEKMSKSKGNVVNPDDIIQSFGADTLRVYEMFMGPFDQAIPWSTNNIVGSRRFLEHVWRLYEKIDEGDCSKELESTLNKAIKKVSEDIEALKFNTAVSQLMILVNEFEKCVKVNKESYKILLQLVAPFAPHLAEELWEVIGEKESIHLAVWPKHDESKIVNTVSIIVIQVNGKVRGQIEVDKGMSESEIHERATSSNMIEKWIHGKDIQNIVYVPFKIINIVLKE